VIKIDRLHRIKLRTTAVALTGAVLLGACVELPTAPTVAVMPSPYKPFEVFQSDDQVCRGFAYQQIGGKPSSGTASTSNSNLSYYGLQYQYNLSYQQCMYSKGNQIPGFAPPVNAPAGTGTGSVERQSGIPKITASFNRPVSLPAGGN